MYVTGQFYKLLITTRMYVCLLVNHFMPLFVCIVNDMVEKNREINFNFCMLTAICLSFYLSSISV